MGRIDVQQLNVPADFAAILEQQVKPTEESLPQAAPALPYTETAPASQSSVCPSCKSRMSAVEAKMGRCLTCGHSLSSGGSYTVGL